MSVTDVVGDVGGRLKTLAGEWSKVTLLGSFALYLIGYLAVRFHLAALGMATDLSVVDERYLFTGARFLVYLVASVPISVLMAFLIWRTIRLLPAGARAYLSTPVFGIIFAILVIQLVLRQCFLVSNLLLANDLSRIPPWLGALLLDDTFMLLYFSTLIAACLVPVAILAATRSQPAPPLQRGLLAFFAAVQFLFLPVNYGVLILDKTLPRVAALGAAPLGEGERAWLVWEGNEGVTFLVDNPSARRRALLTLPRPEITRTEVVGFDPIVPTLFSERRGGDR